MLNIGCHLSATKGYMNMGKEAKSIDANTFQFFTRNPRGGKAKAIDEQDVKNFLEFMKENNFSFDGRNGDDSKPEDGIYMKAQRFSKFYEMEE